MLHSDASADGADVLATIRRLLAQDQRTEDSVTRDGALRRRLIGTRRHGARIEAAAGAGETPPVTVPPLRLADTQRVVPMGDDTPQTALSDHLASGPVMDAVAADAQVAGAVATATLAAMCGPADTPVEGESDGRAHHTWPFGSDHAVSRLRELLTFQAWIDEGDEALSQVPAEGADPAGDIASPEIVLGAEVQPPAEQADDAVAPYVAVAVPPGLAASDAEVLQVVAEPAATPPLDLPSLIRETLIQELAGETGTHLTEVIQNLTRRAVAGALADLSREMGGLYSSDGHDLH